MTTRATILHGAIYGLHSHPCPEEDCGIVETCRVPYCDTPPGSPQLCVTCANRFDDDAPDDDGGIVCRYGPDPLM